MCEWSEIYHSIPLCEWDIVCVLYQSDLLFIDTPQPPHGLTKQTRNGTLKFQSKREAMEGGPWVIEMKSVPSLVKA